MDQRCRGCIQEKGTHICILTAAADVRPDLVDCPCAQCLVKVTCNEQCKERRTYFVNNIKTIQMEVGDYDTM